MIRILNYLRGVDLVTKDPQSSLSEKIYTLNKKFLKRIHRTIKILFPRLLSISTCLFILLLIIVVALEFVIYQVGLLPGKYYSVLITKDLSGFRDLSLISIGFIIVNAVLKSLSDFIASLLRITWRKQLTLKLNECYFKNKNFYYIQIQAKKIYENIPVVSEDTSSSSVLQSTNLLLDPRTIHPSLNNDESPNLSPSPSSSILLDNPDQRITQDVDSMCFSMSKIISVILISPFIIAYYIYQAFQKAGYSGPLAVFIYFIIGGLLNGPLMSPIAAVVYLQDKLEGFFRYKYMSIRTHAESIAFYDSANTELVQTNKIFRSLLTASYRRNWKEMLLKLCVNTLQYLGGIFSYLILAIPIFTDIYNNLKPEELGKLISNYAFICGYLVFLFTRLYDLSNEISIIAGNSHRVGQLLEIMTKQQPTPGTDTTNTNEETDESLNQTLETTGTSLSRPESPINTDICFKAENLSIMTPDRSKTLIKNLTFKFEINTNILIQGRSGCGKTSLFRCISGLWNSYTGVLTMTYKQFKPSNIFFLPQTPYFTNGSLLEQVIYPSSVSEIRNITDTTNSIKSWLNKFDLEHILNKVGNNLSLQPNFNWASILSLGEQQRLSFLRVLYHSPKFALLDEFTSSVDQEVESLMYETLKEMHITYISIAHRDTVRKFHDIELKIVNNGDYTLKPIDKTNN